MVWNWESNDNYIVIVLGSHCGIHLKKKKEINTHVNLTTNRILKNSSVKNVKKMLSMNANIIHQ